jgi:hypothetical protein
MASVLLWMIIPAIVAFVFAAVVAYYAFADIEERLYYYYGFPDAVQLNPPS